MYNLNLISSQGHVIPFMQSEDYDAIIKVVREKKMARYQVTATDTRLLLQVNEPDRDDEIKNYLSQDEKRTLASYGQEQAVAGSISKWWMLGTDKMRGYVEGHIMFSKGQLIELTNISEKTNEYVQADQGTFLLKDETNG